MFYIIIYKDSISNQESSILVKADGYSKDRIKEILEEVRPIKIISIESN